MKAGKKIGVDGRQLYSIALNGLGPVIRQHVIQHPPSDLEDLRRWGRITELSLKDSAIKDAPFEATAHELSELKDEIRKLRINAVVSPPRAASPALDVVNKETAACTEVTNTYLEDFQHEGALSSGNEGLGFVECLSCRKKFPANDFHQPMRRKVPGRLCRHLARGTCNLSISPHISLSDPSKFLSAIITQQQPHRRKMN